MTTINVDDFGMNLHPFEDCDFIHDTEDPHIFYMTRDNDLVIFKQQLEVIATTNVKTYLTGNLINGLAEDVIRQWIISN